LGKTDHDPHLYTFDGMRYDFQATGEFLLFERADDPSAMRMQVRQRALSADLCPHVTLNVAVAMSVGGTRVGIYADESEPLEIGDVPTALADGEARDLGDGASVMASGEAWVVYAPDGTQVEITREPWRGDQHLNVSVHVPSTWRESLRGLLGNFDGDPSNDFVLRDGTMLSQPTPWESVYSMLGESYRIAPAESLFNYPVGKGPADYQSATPPSEPSLADILSPDVLLDAEPACAATKVQDPALINACILDVACSGGDARMAEWIKQAPATKLSADLQYGANFSATQCKTLSIPDYQSSSPIAVPADGTPVALSNLELGVPYKIRIFGTVHRAAQLADAEYDDASLSACSDGTDFGVGVDAPLAVGPKTTNWGAPCASHAYTIDVIGRGEPLAARYYDCGSAQNAGALKMVTFVPTTIGSHPNLIVNGSFEQSSVAPGAWFPLPAGDTRLDGWQITAEVDYIQDDWSAADGQRSIDMNSTAAGGIAQLVPTTVGARYWVFFDLAGNVHGSPTVKSLRVSAGGTSADYQFDVSRGTTTAMGWTSQAFLFVATSDSTLLQFVSLIDGAQGAALDNVRMVRDSTDMNQ
jgi:choice-of-anchor C domain-containing protein